jgi:hypothetical protein
MIDTPETFVFLARDEIQYRTWYGKRGLIVATSFGAAAIFAGIERPWKTHVVRVPNPDSDVWLGELIALAGNRDGGVWLTGGDAFAWQPQFMSLRSRWSKYQP